MGCSCGSKGLLGGDHSAAGGLDIVFALTKGSKQHTAGCGGSRDLQLPVEFSGEPSQATVRTSLWRTADWCWVVLLPMAMHSSLCTRHRLTHAWELPNKPVTTQLPAELLTLDWHVFGLCGLLVPVCSGLLLFRSGSGRKYLSRGNGPPRCSTTILLAMRSSRTTGEPKIVRLGSTAFP